MNRPTAFLSYSWDSKDHRRWVRHLGTALREGGVYVKLDEWDLGPGSDLPQYMETGIRESHFVLFVCTPIFAERANARLGGVGYEQTIATGEILVDAAPNAKFIPLLRAGNAREAVPSFLKSRVWVDFRNDQEFKDRVRELLRHLRAGFPLADGEHPARMPNQPDREEHDDLEVYREAYEFATDRWGLSLSNLDAEEFADMSREEWSLDELADFIRIFEFARDEMDLDRDEAEEFATKWVEWDSGPFFKIYEDAFLFAIDSDGVNLRAQDAHRFLQDFEDEYGLDAFTRFQRAYTVARETGKTHSDAEAFAFDEL